MRDKITHGQYSMDIGFSKDEDHINLEISTSSGDLYKYKSDIFPNLGREIPAIIISIYGKLLQPSYDKGIWRKNIESIYRNYNLLGENYRLNALDKNIGWYLREKHRDRGYAILNNCLITNKEGYITPLAIKIFRSYIYSRKVTYTIVVSYNGESYKDSSDITISTGPWTYTYEARYAWNYERIIPLLNKLLNKLPSYLKGNIHFLGSYDLFKKELLDSDDSGYSFIVSDMAITRVEGNHPIEHIHHIDRGCKNGCSQHRLYQCVFENYLSNIVIDLFN